MNTTLAIDWFNLTQGSTVTLSDEQSLLDSKKRGFGLKPINFSVQKTVQLKELNDLATWTFVELNDGVQPLQLMVKEVDDKTDFFLYYQSEDFTPITRQKAIDRGDQWLFEAPGDSSNFNPLDLKYTNDLTQTVDGKDITYTRKPQGELNGMVHENPASSGLNSLLGTIVEYSTKAETENPEVLLLEIGEKLNRRGGEITLYFGTKINSDEIEVLSL